MSIPEDENIAQKIIQNYYGGSIIKAYQDCIVSFLGKNKLFAYQDCIALLLDQNKLGTEIIVPPHNQIKKIIITLVKIIVREILSANVIFSHNDLFDICLLCKDKLKLNDEEYGKLLDVVSEQIINPDLLNTDASLIELLIENGIDLLSQYNAPDQQQSLQRMFIKAIKNGKSKHNLSNYASKFANKLQKLTQASLKVKQQAAYKRKIQLQVDTCMRTISLS